MTMEVEITQTCEVQVYYPVKAKADHPKAKALKSPDETLHNAMKVREISKRERDGQMIVNLQLVEGAVVTLPDDGADELIKLKLAKKV